ncbi:MAG TPA: DUF4375 domain-containing protein [Bryobacteraceae bacterium]|nr:DUF4375 domain-containing protein [Bryobacteraceae bacterium]
MDRLDDLQPIANRLIDRYVAAGLPGLEPRDRVFFLAWCYGAELDNGGHAAFFYNSEADNYSETTDALRELGLVDCAEWLERAARCLFGSSVPRTMTERNEVIDSLPDDPVIDDELEELDQAFSAAGGATGVLDSLYRWYFPASRDRG